MSAKDKVTIPIWSRLHLNPVSLTAVSSLVVQVGRPLISLATLPFLFQRLGQEGLGVWMVALSLIGLVGFVSAGLSTSVVTAIGRAGPTSKLLVNRIATAATLISIVWGTIILVVVVPIAQVVDWGALLNVTNAEISREVAALVVALAIILGLSLFVSVPRQIMVGRMNGYVANLLDFLGVLLGAGALIVGLLTSAPLWVLVSMYLGPSIAVLLAGGWIYLRRVGVPILAWRYFDRPTLRALGADSLRMAAYQSAYAISSQSDLLLIAMFVGSPASAAYGVAQRVFSLPILISAAVNYAQWPLMARADASGDRATVRRMFRRTLVIGSGLAAGAAVLLALGYDPIVKLWLGHPPATDPGIVSGMVIWVAVATVVNTCDSVLRARNETALLMLSMWAMALINVATTLVLLPHIGPAGAIWGSVVGFLLGLLLPYAVRLRELLYRSPRLPRENTDAR